MTVLSEQRKYYNSIYKKQKTDRVSKKTDVSMRGFVSKYIKSKYKEILEIGCGDGLLTKYLLKSGREITTIDISKIAIESVKEQYKSQIILGKIVPIEGDAITYLSKSKKKYDAIVGSGIIHHIDKKYWMKLFRSAYKCIKPGGILVIGPEPNANGLYYYLWRFAPLVYRIIGVDYTPEVERGTFDMKTRYLSKCAKLAGFSKVNIDPYQHFPDFNINFLITLNRLFNNIASGKNSMYFTIRAEK